MEEKQGAQKVKIGNAEVNVVHPSIFNVVKQRQRIKEKLSGIKHKIGVYSAKGGVGKTTVAVNIAFTLRDMGFKVGLLDADIDCPNLHLFLDIKNAGEPVYPLKPLEKDGVKVISTAMFVDEAKRPIIWRGPMVAKMLSEFLEMTEWGELDYLILDCSPGTSDSNLSIMQLLDMDGFVLVTTPQHIAAINAIRSGMMAKRLGVSVLGVVENMSNGKTGGGKEVADALKCDLFGEIKSSNIFNTASDSGKIPVSEDSEIKEEFIRITKRLISGGD
ncbi:MAG: P-loop NTPase [Candidatus Micrarchaeota archaeon]|nr:P-loop NTPase [Candidatus Micrarchaeota archaeon]